MTTKPTQDQQDAASWLMLAYSLNHPNDCACERCEKSRGVLKHRKTRAA